jgi:hypothetical protein
VGACCSPLGYCIVDKSEPQLALNIIQHLFHSDLSLKVQECQDIDIKHPHTHRYIYIYSIIYIYIIVLYITELEWSPSCWLPLTSLWSSPAKCQATCSCQGRRNFRHKINQVKRNKIGRIMSNQVPSTHCLLQ